MTDARLVAPLPEGGDDRTMALAAGACSNRTTAMLVLEEVGAAAPRRAGAGARGRRWGRQPARALPLGLVPVQLGGERGQRRVGQGVQPPLVLAAAAPASRATAIAARSG